MRDWEVASLETGGELLHSVATRERQRRWLAAIDVSTLPNSCTEAKEQGAKYYLGIPCRRDPEHWKGGSSTRYTSTSACVECNAARNQSTLEARKLKSESMARRRERRRQFKAGLIDNMAAPSRSRLAGKEAEIVADYKAGMTPRKIAEKYGLKRRKGIVGILLGADVTLRDDYIWITDGSDDRQW